MRLEKAIAVSLAIHLLLTGGIAISHGIKRNGRKPVPEAVFAELVPPPVAPIRAAEPAPPDRPAEQVIPESPVVPSPAAAEAEAPGSSTDNAAAPMARFDPQMLEQIRMHHQAIVSTAEFYKSVPGELTRLVNEQLADGTLMAQGDALIHMDVTPSGQVGSAHVQANSQALLNRLDRVKWADTLPPRPLAACNAIHLRISVVGNDIHVDVEML